MSSAAALVEQLAAITLEQHVHEPDELARALAERDALIEQLRRVDTSALATDERAALKERMRAILTRDAAFIEQLSQLREETVAALEQLATGRTAARGYGEALSSTRSSR